MKLFTKKRVVLLALFILPLVFFLFLSTGINNFSKLPVITSNIQVPNEGLKELLKNKATVLVFFGKDPIKYKSGFFNVNEKLYKKFYDHKFYQTVAVAPKNSNYKELLKKLGAYTDISKWNVVELDSIEVINFHKNLNSGDVLNENLYVDKAYILDKQNRLRGRKEDEEVPNGLVTSYNINSVSELKNKMQDDIEVLLYEYRAAFKNKNKAERINN